MRMDQLHINLQTANMKYCSNCKTTFYTWIQDHLINLSGMDTQMRFDTWFENYPEHLHPHCLLLLVNEHIGKDVYWFCLLYTSPSPRD